MNLKRRKRGRGDAGKQPEVSRKTRGLVQLSLIICAAIFIAAGIARGDAAALWRKAVFVCLECIGIG